MTATSTTRWRWTRRTALAGAGLLFLGCAADAELEPPRPLYGEDPIDYPLGLWDRGVEGETVVRVRVDDTGVVDSAVVLEGSGYPELDSAAVAGVARLQFAPARRGERRTTAWVRVPVKFSKKPRPGGGAP